MAVIRVNNETNNLLGTITFERHAVYDEESGIVTGQMITGLCATREYIEDLYEIETERFVLTDVNVYKESFGSNEYMILYHFNAGDVRVKEDVLHEDIKWLIEENMIEKEKEDGEWFHAYLQKDALKEAEKLAKTFIEQEDANED